MMDDNCNYMYIDDVCLYMGEPILSCKAILQQMEHFIVVVVVQKVVVLLLLPAKKVSIR
jgi:hypothetical protein